MQLSAGNASKSMMNEPCEDRKEHESKKPRLVDGLLELSEEMDCEFLDVEVTMTMTMTMTHSEKSHICRMKAWPNRQQCRGHNPTKKNLLCC